MSSPGVRMAAVPHTTRPTVFGTRARLGEVALDRRRRPAGGRRPTPTGSARLRGRPSRSCAPWAARGPCPGSAPRTARRARSARRGPRAVFVISSVVGRRRARGSANRSALAFRVRGVTCGRRLDAQPASRRSSSRSTRRSLDGVGRDHAGRPVSAGRGDGRFGRRPMPRPRRGDGRPQRRDRALGEAEQALPAGRSPRRPRGGGRRCGGRRGSGRPSARRGSRRCGGGSRRSRRRRAPRRPVRSRSIGGSSNSSQTWARTAGSLAGSRVDTWSYLSRRRSRRARSS